MSGNSCSAWTFSIVEKCFSAVLEYQTVVMRRDFDTADKVLPTVPKAHFLEKNGFKNQVLAVS